MVNLEKIYIERNLETGEISYRIENLSHFIALALLETVKQLNYEAMIREAKESEEETNHHRVGG